MGTELLPSLLEGRRPNRPTVATGEHKRTAEATESGRGESRHKDEHGNLCPSATCLEECVLASCFVTQRRSSAGDKTPEESQTEANKAGAKEL